MRTLVIACVLLSSCSVMIDDAPITGEAPWPASLVREAVDDFVNASVSAFPHEDGHSARCASIEFVPHLEYPGIGDLSGITDGPCTVRISTEYTDELHKTALWHELTHVVLWNTYDDADASHASPPGPWVVEHDDVIKELRASWQVRSANLD